MNWHAHSLSAVNVRKTRRIRDYSVGNERCVQHRIRVDAASPATVQHLLNHLPLTFDVNLTETLHVGDQPGVLDHVRHEYGGVASDRIESEAGLPNKVLEHVMRCQTDTVAMLLQFVAQSDERLDVAPAADDLDDDVELQVEIARLHVGGGRFGRDDLWWMDEQLRECPAEPGIEIHVDTAIIWFGISDRAKYLG